jgi:hypothetical protein
MGLLKVITPGWQRPGVIHFMNPGGGVAVVVGLSAQPRVGPETALLLFPCKMNQAVPTIPSEI